LISNIVIQDIKEQYIIRADALLLVFRLK